jgi:hypothetical protein
VNLHLILSLSFGSWLSVAFQSFLLNHLITKTLANTATYVTASTGLASVALGGVTLHSFAAVGLGQVCLSAIRFPPVSSFHFLLLQESTPDLIKKVFSNPNAVKRWFSLFCVGLSPQINSSSVLGEMLILS